MAEFETTYHPINHKKVPLVKKWLSHKGEKTGNYARALSRYDLVIDVDIKGSPAQITAAKNSFEKLQLEGMLPDTKVVTTANGGYHYHYKKPCDLNIKQKLTEYPGIEFKSYGTACVGEGSVIDGVEYKCNGKEAVECSPLLLEKIKTTKQIDINNLPITDLLAVSDLKELVSFIPHTYMDQHYKDWLNIGMCLHQATQGSQEGLQIWDDMSQHAKKYEIGVCADKWKTFNSNREGAVSTIGTLYHLAYQNGYTGKLGDILDALPDDKSIELKSKIDLIEELKNWVYASGDMIFFNKEDGRRFSSEQIRLYYSIVWEKDILKRLVGTLSHVDYIRYVPGKPEVILEGKFKCLNAWRQSSVKPEPGNHIKFEEHLQYLFPHDWLHIRNWCAWIAQHPEKRNNWAVLISGGAGVGKTYIATVMQEIVGSQNFKTPSNMGLHEKFNLWCADTQLVVVNEVMGTNRRELTNALKTLLTEKVAPVRKMREDEDFRPMYFNMILLSNYSNAILIDDDDRRFGVFHTYSAKRERSYYEELLNFDDTVKNLPAIYHYLLNVDLSDYDHRIAPQTSAKERLVEEGQSDNFDLYIDEFILNKKYDIFSLSQVNDYLQNICSYEINALVTPQRVAFLLRSKFAFLRRVRVRGKMERLYCIKEKTEYYTKLGNTVLIGLWEAHTGLSARIEYKPFNESQSYSMGAIN